jgi:hypothetical protein
VSALALAGGGSAVSAQEPDFCGTAEVDVPDTGSSFDFTEACANHDACYTMGGGPLDRLRCDNQFLREMIQWCESEWAKGDPRLIRCKLVAGAYYSAARLGGWLFFYH